MTKRTLIPTALAAMLACAQLPALYAQDLEREPLRPAREEASRDEASCLAAEARPRIAVLDFTGADPAAGEKAAQLLRESLESTGDFSVPNREDMARTLAKEKLGLTGVTDPGEAAAIGRVLGAKYVVTGSVSGTGKGYSAAVRFISAADGRLVSAKTVTAPGRDFFLGIVNYFSKEGYGYLGAAHLPKRQQAAAPAPAVPPAVSTVPAAAPAAVSTAPAAGDVTYEQVLERPDDIELNYAFARTRVRQGDLKGAAAALERILMLNPSLDAIRLFYAVVLYRLDVLPEAKREFKTVAEGRASGAVKSEAQSYLKVIRRRELPTTFSAGLSAGAEYDSNRNASPLSQKRLFLDTPLALTGDSLRKDDFSLLTIADAEVRRVVDASRRHEVFGSLSYFRTDQARVASVNLQALSAKLGGVYKAGRYELTPALSWDRVLLAREKFLVNTGGSLRLDGKPGKRDSFWAELGYVYQDNFATPAVSSNPERRGPLYTVSAGADRVLTPVMKAGAGLTYTAKLAAKDYDAYGGLALNLRHQWLLGRGFFLMSSLCLGNDVYREADAAISRRVRKDATLRAGTTLGAPAQGLFGGPDLLKDLTLTLSLEYFRANSTVLNYTYENFKAALLLGYRWDAGL